MMNKKAAAILTALLYSQAFLGFAAAAVVLLKDRGDTVQVASTSQTASADQWTLIR